eukprot:GHVO01056496.1.p1 GENE.GHVO01056496.1~~GHVO01056496.1.p1  ORF type:complete len:548 (-),score=91.75 GHVO01056496.1:272-1765(-)
MVVGGGGQMKVTKDGNVLLHEMQIQHPTASMIARASTAQDTITGDGSTSNVLLIGEIVKQCERYILDGVHPRALCDGIDAARTRAMEVLDTMKDPVKSEYYRSVATTSLLTKLPPKLAESLADIVVGAIECIKSQDPNDAANGHPSRIDLHMVEVLHMKHRCAEDTRLVKGMVMDHGCRHPDMPKKLKNCFILTCNVSLEYEKSEVNSTFTYSNVSQRENLVVAERKFTDDKVRKIIDLKRAVCGADSGKSFVILNQKGIDPPALDMLAKENIMALRRVKRRNMERLVLCCGGSAVNSVDELTPSDLGYADEVHETQLGEEKYTFVEGVRNPRSCTILITGQNERVIAQIKDAIRDGLHAIRNAIEDECVIPGAGAFEIAAHGALVELAKTHPGKSQLGIQAFADALLGIPRALIANAGFDDIDTILTAVMQRQQQPDIAVGISLDTGKVIMPASTGIWDNYRVKRQMLVLAPSIAQQLLLVDEVIKAGKQMGGGKQ